MTCTASLFFPRKSRCLPLRQKSSQTLSIRRNKAEDLIQRKRRCFSAQGVRGGSSAVNFTNLLFCRFCAFGTNVFGSNALKYNKCNSSLMVLCYFTGSYLSIFHVLKITNTNCKYREAVSNTLVRKSCT